MAKGRSQTRTRGSHERRNIHGPAQINTNLIRMVSLSLVAPALPLPSSSPFMEVRPEKDVSLSLEDCLKLLKGERDEQRLAGLFLVTKICNGEDTASLTRIYDAVGVTFLDRLLKTGMGKGAISGPGNENRDAYLQLSVRVLAVFCRVHEIASSKEMVSKIPLILESLSNESCFAVLEDCFEFLYLVSTASEDAVMTLYNNGGLKMLAFQMSKMTDGSHPTKLAIQLVQMIIRKLSIDVVIANFLSELSMIVSITSRQFGILHASTKFEALHLLSVVFSSNSTQLYDALCIMPANNWSKHIHDGIMAVLHNRVAPADRFHALILAESMMSMLGESWLIVEKHSLDTSDPPADRCLLLVLEQSRVEVAVLLNELAYLKYEATKDSSSSMDIIRLKQQNVAVAFSLVEKIIKLISNADENLGKLIDENTCTKVIMALNETIGVVLEYLRDAKEHGERKGDDLLASVRIIGSYLAETPVACEEKVRELLGYMLSVEGEDEQSPFYSVCFLLPMLCQITMKAEGCKALAISGGYNAVIDCLIRLVGPNAGGIEDNGCVFLACDTIMNFLLKEQVQFPFDKSAFVHLLKALASWTENTDDPSVVMMAASLCTLVCDYTSEDALVRDPDFGRKNLDKMSRLFSRSLSSVGQGTSDDAIDDNSDLLEIITSGLLDLWQDIPDGPESFPA